MDKMVNRYIGHISLLVNDYDEAINFYVGKLGFELLEDTVLDENKRWVIVSPKGNGHCALLLAKAVGDEQISKVGNQTGGRVFLFLYTDDFERDYQLLISHDIKIIRPRRKESYGEILVFEDLYGNLWDLIKPS